MAIQKDDSGTYFVEKSLGSDRVRIAVAFSPTLWALGPRVEWEWHRWLVVDLNLGPVAVALIIGDL